MAEPQSTWTAEQLAGDGVSKKELVTFLQENGSMQFQQEQKLKGALKNVAKTRTKDQLIAAYNTLFETKAFKKEGEDEAAAAENQAKQAAKVAEAAALVERTKKISLSEEKEAEVPKYRKKVTKKGDKTNFPTKGETVACYYTGKLADGTVFDTNVVTGRKAKSAQPLRFKVGVGKVIRGWDEALLTMSAGEKAEITIEPEWAYGRKGIEGKVPPNSTLIFEVDLVSVGC